jgi:hypothetical protein
VKGSDLVHEQHDLSWPAATFLGVCAVACGACTNAANGAAPDGGGGDGTLPDVAMVADDAGDGAVDDSSDADAGGCGPINLSGFQPPPYPYLVPSAPSLACNGQNGDAGCVQDVDPTEAGTSCARALYAAGVCALYACESTCPVTDDVSRAAFEVCTNEALSGACAGYALPATSCVVAEKGDGGTPVATVCFAGSPALDHYLAFAKYFCGGG